MRAKIMYFSLAVALVIIFLFLFKRHEVPAALVCSAKNHLVLNTQKTGMHIEGEVLLVFRISSAEEGVLSQVGVINVNGKSYAINRSTMLKFLGNDSDGYIRTQRVSVIKNDNDDLPDEITGLIMSKQHNFYYKIMHIANNVYGIRDLRRTLLVCRAA
ncbi:hypothetical protein ACLQUA_000426 [Enterobacter ludwigii]|jgi:hypothetical protein|uniref:hypothetical protein n=1 Tax=Enterobacter TaxID=547 RepID=UPI0006820E33|nr:MULTISPECIES: hypothetical protein [Enterobacter]GJK55350.1 hypothetical protein TUM17561_27680 [Enterobacter cloacae]MBQ0312887.1 hypothetical protein [Enterobacter ludwigii]MDP5159956.1 hypothetical protein [Enterobacter ludwigii]MDV8142511.1 hypothetical protein [Enterobacter ludwigii]MXV01562.1 hypothetical protein [Enterobacter sp. ABFQC]